VKLLPAVALLIAACGGTRTREPAPAPVTTPNIANTSPPLPSAVNVCDQMIDTAKFTTALGEAATVELRDHGEVDREATASCGLIKAGTPPDERAQAELMKKTGRLGVLPGDELCRVTAYCGTTETEASFRERCDARGNRDDPAVGGVSCVKVVYQGADDVNVYDLLDEDTGCVLSVRGGPSVVDNALIAACANAARALIGPDQIAGRR
jgi:hypothetical protein